MLMSTVLYLGFFFVIMYFLIIRPQKKRDKQVADMQSSIKVGDEVLLNTGIYGKVVDIINDLFIIELGLNKSVRIPVKQVAVAAVAAPNLTIAKASEPVDDEDEYEDDEYEDGEYEDEDEE
ncbi:MAG: preprotein translocase subunit YajC [Candidatus Niameybacter stercoravium]|uniref:Preprotein translocase subunit YajC n=2 Tax=Lachnospiraceae TaxID=186803 RepID=A0A926EKL9_9FIRM|nr:preprotein translocase subunit YajC [Zhenhengia yiwuensis]MBP3911249.1 preprotein translocase subunit YajC [Niameybacter sp.]MBS5317214.1 preprotein translocase subunit YajC [Clostridiales bacterium]MBS5800287.1 preprotein translocase subunit YajC [Clostridiales bacterium]MBU3810364.1 preprotein translocase subunit YajC [Candidatus Niameybacter stercoravium]